MRYIIRLFLLLILVTFALGAIYVSLSNPAITQDVITKQISNEKIEIDE